MASLRAQARALGICPSAIVRRRRLGWTEEEATTIPPQPRGGAFKRGRVFRATDGTIAARSINELAAMTGLRAKTIQQRLEAGWSDAEIMVTPSLGPGGGPRRKRSDAARIAAGWRCRACGNAQTIAELRGQGRETCCDDRRLEPIVETYVDSFGKTKIRRGGYSQ